MKPMTLEEKKIEFAVFCIECLAERQEKHPEEVYNRLCYADLMSNYVVRFYDTLHTQSKAYIVDELVEVLERREKGKSHVSSQ